MNLSQTLLGVMSPALCGHQSAFLMIKTIIQTLKGLKMLTSSAFVLSAQFAIKRVR